MALSDIGNLLQHLTEGRKVVYSQTLGDSLKQRGRRETLPVKPTQVLIKDHYIRKPMLTRQGPERLKGGCFMPLLEVIDKKPMHKTGTVADDCFSFQGLQKWAKVLWSQEDSILAIANGSKRRAIIRCKSGPVNEEGHRAPCHWRSIPPGRCHVGHALAHSGLVTVLLGAVASISEKLSMADRRFLGSRCLYRFRIASVWCPMNSSMIRWSTPAAARLLAKL